MFGDFLEVQLSVFLSGNAEGQEPAQARSRDGISPRRGARARPSPGCASVTGLGPAALPQGTDQHPTAALGQGLRAPG